jgi:hypothetical protein
VEVILKILKACGEEEVEEVEEVEEEVQGAECTRVELSVHVCTRLPGDRGEREFIRIGINTPGKGC